MSEPKHIICIRHGECISNRTNIHQAGNQYETDPLDEVGERQVRNLAARFKGVPLDIILASSYLRTMQTARAIQQTTATGLVVPVLSKGKVVDIDADKEPPKARTALLRELDLPSELAGLDLKDPAALKINEEVKKHVCEEGWHYSDEENFHDVWQRAGVILRYLESRPESIIAVVSHGGILKACLARILQNKTTTLSLEQRLEVYQSFLSQTWWDNAGVVSLKYSVEEGWQWLMTDNQHIGTTYFGFMSPVGPIRSGHGADTAPGTVYETAA